MRNFLLFSALFCFACVNPAWADHHEPAATDSSAAVEEQQQEWNPVDGEIVHTEIYVTDLDAAMEFYSTLFGWTFSTYDETYYTFMTPGDCSGGITNMAPPGGGGTLVYMFSSNIEAKLAEIEEAGGSIIMGKTEIEGVGWFALFGDPDGNILGLFSM